MLSSAWLVPAGTVGGPASSFPFAFRDGLIWVSVRVPPARPPLNFLLDSGAGVSALSSAAARHLGISLTDSVLVHGVHTQSVGYWTTPLVATVGAVPLRQRFLVVDLEGFSRRCHCAVDGLLGADFFRHRVVQLDFEAEQVRLLARAAPTATRTVLPLASRNGALLLPIRVNGGRPQWARLDTGCASALEWVRDGPPPPGVVPRVSIGLAEITIPQTRSTVELGGALFEHVPTGLHAMRIFPGESGLLGSALLSRFTVTVDAPAGRLILDRRRPR
ncbi:MAG: retroviral-like aspartic protease family protein [Verrucomicrobia bacterium]|nr:retroviral-like aspartic protease family protein [Verrucomicrobiota bacterium]